MKTNSSNGRMIRRAALVCILAASVAAGCNLTPKQSSQSDAARSREAPVKSIDEVIKIYSDSLMTIPGVVGLYHGLDDSGRTCLKVMVTEKTPELEKRIPERLEGYPVVIDETGEIRPLRKDAD